jgi:hypothetical protein
MIKVDDGRRTKDTSFKRERDRCKKIKRILIK